MTSLCKGISIADRAYQGCDFEDCKKGLVFRSQVPLWLRAYCSRVLIHMELIIVLIIVSAYFFYICRVARSLKTQERTSCIQNIFIRVLLNTY